MIQAASRVAAVLLLAALATAGPLDAYERAMEREQYDKAVRLAARLVDQHPESTIAAYSLACALARAGDADAAVRALARSAELGYAGVRSIESDEDLDPIRDHGGFEAVADRVRANAEARFAEFRELAEHDDPIIRFPPGHDPAVPTPLVIALHGSGGTGAGTSSYWAKATDTVGAILIAPDALRPMRGTNGYSWTYRDEAEWYVLQLLAEARQRWAIGPVVLVGFSQGANVAFAIAQDNPERFEGVIPVCGHYEADVAGAPTEGDRPRWMLLTGSRDRAAGTYRQAEADLEAAGMEVHRHVVGGMGHELPRGRKGETMLTEALVWAFSGRAE